LTGGPCGGKTSTLSHLRARLEALGWRVFTIPEIATLLYSNGVDPREATDVKNISFRLALMRGQKSHEDIWRSIADLSSCAKKVMLQDRGLLDEFPYTANRLEFDTHLKALGLSGSAALARFNLVLHLTSVAVDAPELYSKANNAHRHEAEVQEAAQVDTQTWEAWRGHPNLHRIDNRDSNGNIVNLSKKFSLALGIVSKYLEALSS